MSDPKKHLMPEVLPAPVARPGGVRVRDRVMRHLDQLRRFGVAAGAASVATCACVACDPIPAPAVCDTLDSQQFVATASRSGDTITLRVNWIGTPGGTLPWTFVDTSTIVGGTVVNATVKDGGERIEVTLRPDAGAAQIDLDLRTTCAVGSGSTTQGVLSAVIPLPTDDAGTPVDGFLAVTLHFR